MYRNLYLGFSGSSDGSATDGLVVVEPCDGRGSGGVSGLSDMAGFAPALIEAERRESFEEELNPVARQ